MRETGTLRFWLHSKGFGFVQRDSDSLDIFLHARQVREAGLREVNEGDRLSFEVIETSANKFAARSITLLEAAP